MSYRPLAERMRPTTFDEYVGQSHIVGKDSALRRQIEKGVLSSIIFWGPPGTGKTTLARIIANAMNSNLKQLSATMHGVKELRQVFEKAQLQSGQLFGKKTILFIDEIHRFNKAQQDALLPYVENGTVTLIGATTENPSFEVNNALLSRSRVFVLNRLEGEEILKIIANTLADVKRGLGEYGLQVHGDAKGLFIKFANGDARSALNSLEAASEIVLSDGRTEITVDDVTEAFQQTYTQYDRNGEEHYNTISAFIKSMRAGDTNAALYYLARMVKGGEDPKFIARRMVIFASEDIGMAQPTALVVANEVFKACEVIGYPECQINLAHGTVYLSEAPKDRSSYDAYNEAVVDVEEFGNLPIPFSVRNAPTKLMKGLGYGKGYEKYPSSGSYLPNELQKKKYYSSKE